MSDFGTGLRPMNEREGVEKQPPVPLVIPQGAPFAVSLLLIIVGLAGLSITLSVWFGPVLAFAVFFGLVLILGVLIGFTS